MAFFSNKTINWLNIHLALVNLLDQSCMVFVPIYLYGRGFTLSEVFAFTAMTFFMRAPLRILSIPLARRYGLKPLVMIGAFGFAVSFPVLGKAQGFDIWLMAYLLLYGMFNSMHWLGFHTFYSLAGEHEKRGRHVAVGYALSAGLCALAPLASAFAIEQSGFTRYFLFAGILMVFMLCVLSRCRNIRPDIAPWKIGKKLAFNLGVQVYIVEAASAYPLLMGWMLVVYLYVGKMISFGGIVAFGIVLQTLYQLFLGSHIDRGKGTLVANLAGSLRALFALCATFIPLSVISILGMQTLAAAASTHFVAAEPVLLYNTGKQSAHPFWYWFFVETAWDFGAILGAGGMALLLWFGVTLQHAILLALPFALVLWWLLYRYFRNHADAIRP